MNFIYVIHLMCWNYLIDLITHNRNRNSKNRSRPKMDSQSLELL